MDLGRYVPPDFSDEAPITAIVDDAAIIALSAVRLAAKNLIIVRALRDRVDYDDDWYVAAIRSEFEALATEKDHDAKRVEAALSAARTKRGRGTHPADYRSADVSSLGRRKLILNALAAKLRGMAVDAELAHTVLAAARVDALDEITESVTYPIEAARGMSAAQRSQALNDLAADLDALAAESAGAAGVADSANPAGAADVGGRP